MRLVKSAYAPLHVKYNTLRNIPSLFQYYIFATALSHPEIAFELATLVDDAITNAMEELTDIPLAHPSLLRLHTLRPTVLAARIIIARGLQDHLPDPVRLHLGTARILSVVSDAFVQTYGPIPPESTFSKLTRIANEHTLRQPELELPPVALARWRSLTGDFLQLHRSPLSNEFFLSVFALLANPPEPGDTVPFSCPLCSKHVTDPTAHRLCCYSVSAVRMHRHDLIARGALAATWAECTGTAAELEPPTTLLSGSTAKADIALTDVNGVRRLYDVTVTQPDSVQALSHHSDRTPGIAANLAYRLKLNHYSQSNPPVTPLVWEAYGTPHKETRTALSKIAAAAAEFQRVTHDAFLRTLRSRVCGALLLGVARGLNHYKTLPIMESARSAIQNSTALRPAPAPAPRPKRAPLRVIRAAHPAADPATPAGASPPTRRRRAPPPPSLPPASQPVLVSQSPGPPSHPPDRPPPRKKRRRTPPVADPATHLTASPPLCSVVPVPSPAAM